MDRKLAKTNYDYCEGTIKLRENLELGYLELAKRLHLIELNKMYEPNYDTFDDFLQEISIDRSTANKLINLWRRFVIAYKIPVALIAKSGSWSKVAEVLPLITSKTSAEEWLTKIRVYKRRSDLRKFIKEAKTGVIMFDCRHRDKEIIVFSKCTKCGDTERIYPEQLKHPIELK